MVWLKKFKVDFYLAIFSHLGIIIQIIHYKLYMHKLFHIFAYVYICCIYIPYSTGSISFIKSMMLDKLFAAQNRIEK